MCNSLLKAIELRCEFTNWFAQQAQYTDNENLQRNNATHGFFSATLEVIRTRLKPFAEPSPQPHQQPASHDSTSHSSTTTNMFSALDQMRLADIEEDEQSVPQPKKVHHSRAEFADIVYEAEDKIGDALMATYCLPQDFIELRLTVQFHWHTVSIKKSDMFSAAAVYQGACEIVHILTPDFTARFPELASMQEIVALLLESDTISSAAQRTIEFRADAAAPMLDGRTPVPKLHTQQLASKVQKTYLETFQAASKAKNSAGMKIDAGRTRRLSEIAEEEREDAL
ncbi:hypothetical protein EJ02DRAFT_149491 [Clathrospora elynae]|uniref:DUF6604 domain-containing protein n=1 Tax=Clathrospora elynae TaxID=706981 RepID=A0A6A5STQ8_9PLEO|nr:hypothetical protein EJ02DRAFT_149491 [Clathrospora elynae]